MVHKSTGFNVTTPTADSAAKAAALYPRTDKGATYPTLTPQELKVYRESLPFFYFLHRFAIGIDHLNPGEELIFFIFE